MLVKTEEMVETSLINTAEVISFSPERSNNYCCKYTQRYHF